MPAERASGLRQPRRRSMLQVLDVIWRTGSVSPAGLAASTGLSRATIAAVLRQLERMKLIEDVVLDHERDGAAVQLRRTTAPAICIDLGSRHVAVGAGGPRGLVDKPEIRDFAREPAPLEAIELATELVKAVLRDQLDGLEPAQLVGVCVSVAAPLDQVRGQVAPRAGMDVWVGIRPAFEIQYRLGNDWATVPFAIQNNANLDALAAVDGQVDRRDRELRQDAVLLVRWGNGIGGAALIDGELILGTRGIATEIGHTPLHRSLGDAARCPQCGHYCLDSVASGKALTRALKERHAKERTFDGLVARAVETAGAERDLLVQAAREIGEAVGAYASFLDARLVVLAGYHLASGPDDLEAYKLIGDPLRTGMRETAFPPVLEDVEVAFAAQDRSATIQGGVISVLKRHLAAYFSQLLD